MEQKKYWDQVSTKNNLQHLFMQLNLKSMWEEIL